MMASYTFLALLTIVVTAAGSRCTLGFHEFDGSCYWFSKIKSDFAGAKSTCAFLQSNLAIVTSASKNDFLRNHARSKDDSVRDGYFLGASDLLEEAHWRWEDGQRLVYDNWAPNEPNNRGNHNGEHCLCLWKHMDFKWNDIACESTVQFICEYELGLDYTTA